jgi:hypothetical protein
MKYVYLAESSGGRKWNVSSNSIFFAKRDAAALVKYLAKNSPGLKWRVAKYERVK